MEQYMKIGEFAKYAGISRKNLIFYDQMGLLSPEQVGDNHYRLYSYRQLDAVSVIWALRETGMPLKKIKAYLDDKNPVALTEVLSSRRQELEKKIEQLQKIQHMIDARLQVTEQGLSVDPEEIRVRYCPEELLLAGPVVVWTDNTTYDDALSGFFDECDRLKAISGYTLGAVFIPEDLLSQNLARPSRFFYRSPGGKTEENLLRKPAGQYAVGYCRDPYNRQEEAAERILRFLEKNGLTICGDCYGEFLLDEVAQKKEEDYLLQISIPVETRR